MGTHSFHLRGAPDAEGAQNQASRFAFDVLRHGRRIVLNYFSNSWTNRVVITFVSVCVGLSLFNINLSKSSDYGLNICWWVVCVFLCVRLGLYLVSGPFLKSCMDPECLVPPLHTAILVSFFSVLLEKDSGCRQITPTEEYYSVSHPIGSLSFRHPMVGSQTISSYWDTFNNVSYYIITCFLICMQSCCSLSIVEHTFFIS